GKSKSLDFPTMLIFWSLVRNSVVLAVYLLFSVACFLTVHEHYLIGSRSNNLQAMLDLYQRKTEKRIDLAIKKISIWIQVLSYFSVGAVVLIVYQVMLMPMELLNTF
ncbi:MAG TPA: type II secretion system F family protein, partial [Candidatus Faecalicoccus intestinipullorum]|nr:type II secretion system F family protein [Candidatus Faecalicoccus intestinipullorum]